MILSIQLLDFNKDNSSESFLNDLTPTDKDNQTYSQLINRHEEYLEDENEENDMFGFLELDYADITYMCDISIDEAAFNKAKNDCGIFNAWESFGLNKTNGKSFEFLLNMFSECGMSVGFCDENFEEYDIEHIRELIKKKQENSLPVVFSYFFYVLE